MRELDAGFSDVRADFWQADVGDWMPQDSAGTTTISSILSVLILTVHVLKPPQKFPSHYLAGAFSYSLSVIRQKGSAPGYMQRV